MKYMAIPVIFKLASLRLVLLNSLLASFVFDRSCLILSLALFTDSLEFFSRLLRSAPSDVELLFNEDGGGDAHWVTEGVGGLLFIVRSELVIGGGDVWRLILNLWTTRIVGGVTMTISAGVGRGVDVNNKAGDIRSLCCVEPGVDVES